MALLKSDRRGSDRIAVILVALTLAATPAHATRLKDVSDILGVRSNHLVGYGLVTGLAGTGDTDKARFSVESLTAMLKRFGVKISPDAIKVRNVAAVVVTAELPAFAAPGNRLGITVASIGNAKSLAGGILLRTPLRGADGKVYGVAQGAVTVGGFAAGGRAGGGRSKNHLTTGRIPGGALIERGVGIDLAAFSGFTVTLKTPDFTTASRVAVAVNEVLGADIARAKDAGNIHVRIPPEYSDRPVDLIAALEAVAVEPDLAARVVVNERTGTVVVGDGVRIRPVAVAHGGLTIDIKESAIIGTPPAFSTAETVVVPDSDVAAEETPAALTVLPATATLSDLVTALNALGATPRDLVMILSAVASAGALEAELIVE